jgi:protein O-mannosyl-transferase
MSLSSHRVLLLAAALALLTVLAYLPVLGNGFVLLDDGLYVTANARVLKGLTGEGLAWIWSANVANNWHPLTVLSHMLDCQLYGLAPAGHHLTSLLLHLANGLLLFAVLHRMTGALWRSAAAAALFAVHPLHVESVAWVAERKDVLSGLFWMLAMAAYVGYAARPSRGRYLLVASMMILGLMAKPMVVTLPFVLLLLDVWPLGRLRIEPGWSRQLARLAAEKLPLLALSAAGCVVTIVWQTTSLADLDVVPWRLRLANAAVSYATYLGKTLLPRNLAVFYPLQLDIAVWKAAAAAVLIAALTALAVWKARRAPWFLVGWLWYLGTLVPVIGLVQVGRQAMADRYTYLPSIGLFLIVCWGLPELAGNRAGRRVVLAIASVTAILALTVATRAQVRHWSDSVSLFRHALAVTEGNYVAHVGLAKALRQQKDWAGAREQYRAALALRPGLRDALRGLEQVRKEESRLTPSPARPVGSAPGRRRYRSRPPAS